MEHVVCMFVCVCVYFSHNDEGLSWTGLRTGVQHVLVPFESELSSKQNFDVGGVGWGEVLQD